jgi:hypothetical protein
MNPQSNDPLIAISQSRFNEMIDSILRINLMLERQCLEMEKTIRTFQHYQSTQQQAVSNAQMKR